MDFDAGAAKCENMMLDNQQPLRVLQIFGRMDRGGAELRALEVMERLSSSRITFHFCVLSGRHGSLDKNIRDIGGDVYYKGLTFLFPIRFLRHLRRHHYDVVHSHVELFSGFIIWLAFLAKIPVRVAHFHITDDGKGQSIRRRLQRYAMKALIKRFTTRVIGVSEGVMDMNWGWQWRREPNYHVIYQGFDMRRFADPGEKAALLNWLGIEEKCLVCIHVGRMDPQKNHLRLIEIFRELKKLQNNVHLVLLGRGGNEIEQAVIRKIAEYGLEMYVHLLGETEDVVKWLHASDLMIFPSLFEGLPGAVIEAGAVGLPILTSDMPGVREIAKHYSRIRCLSLKESHRTWAIEALDMLCSLRKKDKCQAQTVIGSGSVFDVNIAAKKIYDVWRDCFVESG
jgi:glycosyltransferase involved in cell wall biosynthesis